MLGRKHLVCVVTRPVVVAAAVAVLGTQRMYLLPPVDTGAHATERLAALRVSSLGKVNGQAVVMAHMPALNAC